MQRALVLDNQKNPLMPCHPARARELLRSGKAVVFKCYPFTIMLKERTGGDLQNVELKIDPGSKTSGIALIADCIRGKKVVFAANLKHRGDKIRKSLLDRRAYRRSRRNRKTRYRPPRFNNRRRKIGWLTPSLKSRVDNIVNWAKRLIRFCPISEIAVETVRFDMQKIENPEISSSKYQQGTLFGYELREYLLEKWNRKCAYCSKSNVPLEVEHIVPKTLDFLRCVVSQFYVAVYRSFMLRSIAVLRCGLSQFYVAVYRSFMLRPIAVLHCGLSQFYVAKYMPHVLEKVEKTHIFLITKDV